MSQSPNPPVADISAIAAQVRAKNPTILTTKAGAESVVKSVFETVLASVQQGDIVRVHSFGTFTVTTRAARKGRNPRTGAPLVIAASKSIKFTPFKSTKKGAVA